MNPLDSIRFCPSCEGDLDMISFRFDRASHSGHICLLCQRCKDCWLQRFENGVAGEIEPFKLAVHRDESLYETYREPFSRFDVLRHFFDSAGEPETEASRIRAEVEAMDWPEVIGE